VSATPGSASGRPVLDRYQCYDATTAPGGPAAAERVLDVIDRFDATTVRTIETSALCVPVDVDGRGLVDGTTSLQCMRVRSAGGARSSRRRTVEVENEIANQRLSARKLRTVCVPATAGGVPSARPLDAFTCRPVKRTAGTAAFVERRLALADRFGTRLTRVVKPAEVCTAAGVAGAGTINDAAELDCYTVKDVAGQPRFAKTTIDAESALGPERLLLRRPSMLCVPSAHIVPPACGDGFVDAGEDCDDGNVDDGDGCSRACRLESCGNGVLDAGERCDGAGNGADECCDGACRLVDPDGDGICSRDDVCPDDRDNDGDGDGFCVGPTFNPPAHGGSDPCSREARGWFLKPKLRLGKLDGSPGTQTLKLATRVVLPPTAALGPDVYGVHLRISDAHGRLVLDERIPPGAFGTPERVGWKVHRAAATKWTYLDRATKPPAANGIVKVAIAMKRGHVVDIAVTGRDGSYALTPGALPITVGVELDEAAPIPGGASGVDECGEQRFDVARCTFSGGGSGARTVVCR
jgi:cysteine-rich repeat protein